MRRLGKEWTALERSWEGKGKDRAILQRHTQSHTTNMLGIKKPSLELLMQSRQRVPYATWIQGEESAFFKHPYQNELYFNCNVLLQPEISRS